MGNKLYVGNLPYSFRDSDMEQAFSQYGSVGGAKVMMDRDLQSPGLLASWKWARMPRPRQPSKA